MKKIRQKMLLAGVLVVSAFSLAACGGDDKAMDGNAAAKETTASKETTTEKETTVEEKTTAEPTTQEAVENTESNSSDQDTQAAEDENSNEENGQAETEAEEAPVSGDEEYAGISYSDAVTAVRRQAGSGAEVLNVIQSTTPDGAPAWAITVMPVSASDEAISETYYVNSDGCVLE